MLSVPLWREPRVVKRYLCKKPGGGQNNYSHACFPCCQKVSHLVFLRHKVTWVRRVLVNEWNVIVNVAEYRRAWQCLLLTGLISLLKHKVFPDSWTRLFLCDLVTCVSPCLHSTLRGLACTGFHCRIPSTGHGRAFGSVIRWSSVVGTFSCVSLRQLLSHRSVCTLSLR